MEVFYMNKITNWWKAKTPKGKASFIVSQCLMAFSILALLGLIFCRQLFGNEVGDAVLGEGIENGFVAISKGFIQSGNNVVVSFITLFITFIVVYIFNFIVRLFTRVGKKAKTIGSLIRSLIKYIAVLIDIAIILAVWGVDVASIVAGLGVLTLIIGLGCQSLIQDVVSGLFMVFDDYFDVGDMVIIDGFRGYVSQIGLRSIKIDDRIGDIKTITNSSITSCVNLSREDNWIFSEIDVSYEEDPRKIEAILLKELPLIKDKIPQAIIPPTYLGMSNYHDSGICYKIYATCKAPYRFQLERDLRREFYLILAKYNIDIPYTCITVVKPREGDIPKADASEIDAAEAFERAIRKPADTPKKRSVFQHVKDAYEETLEDTKKDLK